MIFLKNLSLGISGVGVAAASGYGVYYFTTPPPEKLDLSDFEEDGGNPDDSVENPEELEEGSEHQKLDSEREPSNPDNPPKPTPENFPAEKSPPEE